MKIISHKTIKQIPSASSMEMLNNSIYVCGDDSDFLFQISEEGEDPLDEFNKKKEEETPLTSEELKAMLIASQNNPDDCEMCGS